MLGDTFRRAHVTGPTLLLVSGQFLKSRLGLKSLGHRTKILAAIDQVVSVFHNFVARDACSSAPTRFVDVI